jgi:hypothetical protein
MALAVSCVGCSWMATLVVTNRSDGPIVVEHSTTQWDGGCPSMPTVPSLAASPHQGSNAWVEMADTHFTFRRDQCSFTLTLPPRTSLLFATAMSYGGHRSGDETTECLATRCPLRIQAPDGELVVSGSELVRRLEEKSGNLFEMVYERPQWARK